ncbi:MAG: Asp-tRNA(Asn)/Glu-tRNA(Gln) amidotransferase subunit GatC [Lachnoclostridium sp.]|nr:Asp-tRNA(Asn)/Glu-tRNA(Gln) amidotransferase subunit GatC [Lachnospira sp.]MCM1248961.1 Asp-tRNA(Asn)/Glu-tRNA(Gln) amidotransferase subunit GatC [Lachnoclostridium sp.]MCM1535173.1 Asp-tRNA(Asn)/Glu-tRNA(Gln) amidotransferase subunit GatC [Clostridium sp.]
MDRMDDEAVKHIEMLAKLELSDKERSQAKQDMNRILDYIDKLNELNTDAVEPMSHVLPMQNVFREDAVVNGDDSGSMLKNAPCSRDNMFVVPETF